MAVLLRCWLFYGLAPAALAGLSWVGVRSKVDGLGAHMTRPVRIGPEGADACDYSTGDAWRVFKVCEVFGRWRRAAVLSADMN